MTAPPRRHRPAHPPLLSILGEGDHLPDVVLAAGVAMLLGQRRPRQCQMRQFVVFAGVSVAAGLDSGWYERVCSRSLRAGGLVPCGRCYLVRRSASSVSARRSFRLPSAGNSTYDVIDEKAGCAAVTGVFRPGDILAPVNDGFSCEMLMRQRIVLEKDESLGDFSNSIQHEALLQSPLQLAQGAQGKRGE